MVFCKESVKEVPEHTFGKVEIVLPGFGVPMHKFGGVKVNIWPEDGLIVVVCLIKAVLVPPAVLAFHTVVVVLQLKSVADVPLNPTEGPDEVEVVVLRAAPYMMLMV